MIATIEVRYRSLTLGLNAVVTGRLLKICTEPASALSDIMIQLLLVN